jgi:hypothetical protein
MKRFIIILLLIFSTLFTFSQEIRVKTWFDSTRILIGDQVNFNISISHPENMDVNYPAISDTLIGPIEILRSSGPDTVKSKNKEVLVQLRYLITSFDTGFYEVPPIFVETNTGNGVRRYYSDYTAIEVVRPGIAPADSTDVIFDIAGPRKARITFMEVLPWSLLVIVLILTLIFIYRMVGKRKSEVPDEKSHLPAESIHIISLRELDKLEKKELWQKSQHKRYYSQLTEILRTYIDRRFDISSMEMTTAETLHSLMESGFTKGELYSLLEEILTMADQVKFAKYRPVDVNNISSIDNARLFIRLTYQKHKDLSDDRYDMDRMEVSDD